jgi:hypothetical protein
MSNLVTLQAAKFPTPPVLGHLGRLDLGDDGIADAVAL